MSSETRPAARPPLDVAAVQARLHPRAAAGGRRRRADLAAGGAGCAVRPVAGAAPRRDSRSRHPADLRHRRRDGGLGDPDLVAAGDHHPTHPAVPRSGDDRAGDPCGHPAGRGAEPGAAREVGLSRPAVGAAQPGLRAGPHVRVAARHDRLARPGRDHPRSARVDRSAAAVAGRLRRADGDHLVVASRGRAAGRGVLRRAQPAGRPPVRDGDDRRSGEGDPGHRHRAGPGGSAPDRVAALVRPGRPSTLDHRRVAFGGLGLLRARLRRSGRLRRRRPRRPASARCC